MFSNNDADFDAMLELASELSWVEAAKFIRSERGCSLTEAGQLVANRISAQFPGSLAAVSYANRYGVAQS